MDIPTRKISEYIRDKGISIRQIAKKTGCDYMALYNSLSNDSRNRDLRAGEFISVCNFLEKNPMEFADYSPAEQEKSTV